MTTTIRTYTVTHTDGSITTVKIGDKMTAAIKRFRLRCFNCSLSRAETGWKVIHYETHQQDICPRCNSINTITLPSIMHETKLGNIKDWILTRILLR